MGGPEPDQLAGLLINSQLADMASSNCALCALCNTALTGSNDFAEHVIASALGGTWTMKGFICKPCNDTTGQNWDAELAAQLNGLCHFFAIKRDRGAIPVETVTTTAGETFDMLPDGGFALIRPRVEKTQAGAQTQYRVVARDKNEARRILKGIKRKTPNLDVEVELAKAKVDTSYPQGLIELPIQIGGVGAGRAIVKSAVALAHHSEVPVAACDQALAYLRDMNAAPCFGYYQSSDLMVARPRGVPLHCVAISGNPTSGLLLGYVEYFGFHRAVICSPRPIRGSRSNATTPLTRRPGKNSTFLCALISRVPTWLISSTTSIAISKTRYAPPARYLVREWNASESATGITR